MSIISWLLLRYILTQTDFSSEKTEHSKCVFALPGTIVYCPAFSYYSNIGNIFGHANDVKITSCWNLLPSWNIMIRTSVFLLRRKNCFVYYVIIAYESSVSRVILPPNNEEKYAIRHYRKSDLTGFEHKWSQSSLHLNDNNFKRKTKWSVLQDF